MIIKFLPRTGGQVPTMTLHPASAKCFVIAHPYPLASATPAIKAVFPRRSTLKPSMVMVREEEELHGWKRGEVVVSTLRSERINKGMGGRRKRYGDKEKSGL